jgi:ribA/ribD-fused uncharacterized protein
MRLIKFYSTKDEYGYFSNFALYPIFINGVIWPSSEHFFQASKFLNNDIAEKIRVSKSPFEAAQLGRTRSTPIRDDWEDIKIEIMRLALEKKFYQYHDLKIKLLDTGEMVIVEHTANDHYWADGGDGTGKNMLGFLLMELRQKIKKQFPNEQWILPPWVAFPDIDQLDMFWRMGLGENFMYTWAKWYNTQSKEIKLQYQLSFPEPELWKGFYSY